VTRLTGASAVLLVSDIDRAVEFWRHRLGFTCEVYGEPPDFATAARDEATVLLALCRDASAIVPNWKLVDKTWNLYTRVDDADAIYAELQERGAPID
jgi:predicted enzyme related to lactoylglutathione lyase